MLSETDQRRSRCELQSMITKMNKLKGSTLKRTPRFRFRAAVRTVINNLKWLTEESPPVEGPLSPRGPRLTLQVKGLLRSDVEDRSEEDKAILSKIIGNLPCLQRYPENVRQNIAASAIFQYVGPDRVLVSEGRPSFNMYFILSGDARVTKMTYDAGEDRVKAKEVMVLGAGDHFGEVNILHDEPWPRTVSTITHTEILRVEKQDFQTILQEFMGERKEEITRLLSVFSYFKDWSSRTVVECSILARIQEFPKDTLIVGDRVGNLGSSFFIVSGECVVMHHLVAQVTGSDPPEERIYKVSQALVEDTFPQSRLLRGQPRERMRRLGEPHLVHLVVNQALHRLITELPLPQSRTSVAGDRRRGTTIQSHFFRIAVLMAGQCFGVGESLEDKFILSNSDPVVLLEIPRHFLKLHNRGNIWGRVREFFNLTYPSPREVFRTFLTERRWRECRQRYAESALKVDRPFTGLTVAEQPYYYRLFEDILNPMFSRVRVTRDAEVRRVAEAGEEVA